jgi:5-methyltetrahydropteroyltriglutamate--homocysteine methyltransferase
VLNDGQIRVTHIGSLARPPELRALLRAHENGDAYDQNEFQTCLRSSVEDVVRQQRGVDFGSDGEFGKTPSGAVHWRIDDRLLVHTVLLG